jgi:hypothetical protein
VAEEVRLRILDEVAHFGGGALPERVAIAWDGYLAALLEWGLLTVAEHAELVDLLPAIPDNPVLAIFLGRH